MSRTIVLFACATLAACGGSDAPPGPGGDPGPGPGTPNDSFATAAPIALNTEVTAALASAFDEDYFSFTVPTGGRTVRIQTFDGSGTGCTSPGTEITLYDASHTSLGVSGWPGGTCPDETWNLAAGGYFVKVIGYYPGTGTYLLRTTSVVTTPETENNNAIGYADGPFTSDTWIRAALDSTGDQDVFAVRNAAAVPVTVHLETFVGGIGQCYGGATLLSVEDAGGSVLASNDNKSSNDWCSALDPTIPAGTTVYARVVNQYPTAVAEYLLQIEFP